MHTFLKERSYYVGLRGSSLGHFRTSSWTGGCLGAPLRTASYLFLAFYNPRSLLLLPSSPPLSPPKFRSPPPHTEVDFDFLQRTVAWCMQSANERHTSLNLFIPDPIIAFIIANVWQTHIRLINNSDQIM
jgi:hypothetical protein